MITINKIYSVKEFSKISGINDSTLRYWADIGLLLPAERNPKNDYRRYSLSQISEVNFITVLRDMGVSLKDIIEYKNNRDPDKLLGIIERQQKALDMQMHDLRYRYSVMHVRQELIRYGMNIDESEISVSEREDTAINIWPRNKYKEGETAFDALAALIAQTDRHFYFSYPVGAYFDNTETFLKEPKLPNHFFALDPIGRKTWKKGEYLTAFFRGLFGDFGGLHERIVKYAKQNSLTLSGPVYVMALHDELCTGDPYNHLMQISVAVSKSKHQDSYYT